MRSNHPTFEPRGLSYEYRLSGDSTEGIKLSAQGFFDKKNYDPYDNNRFFDNDSTIFENIFEADIRSIIEAAAYRKLTMQGMLAPSVSTAFQNRGSHSQTVAQTAARIASSLHMSPASKSLARAIALAHDIGHPPFSHEGEAAINHRLKKFGIVWDHDVAGLEAVIRDENKDLGHGGLGLSMAVIEGIVKRYWRFKDYGQENTRYEHSRGLLPPEVNRFLSKHEEELHLDEWNHAEGQIATCADWIEGTITDAEDMMTMALFSEKPAESTRAFFEEYIANFPLAKQVYADIKRDMGTRLRAMPPDQRARLKSDMDRRLPVMMKRFSECLRQAMIDDVVKEATETIAACGIGAANIRNHTSLTIQPSEPMRAQLDVVKQYYMNNVYPIIREEYVDTEDMVGRVFDDLVRGDVALPAAWGQAYQAIQDNTRLKPQEKQRDTSLLVANYMTMAMSDQQVLRHMENYHPEHYQQIRQEAHHAPYPTPAYTKDRKAIRARNDIISQLHQLRDTGRLGIHMLEDTGVGEIPSRILQDMQLPSNENPHDAPYFSISTIPSCAKQSAFTELYGVSQSNYMRFGYLLDLRQDRENRIIIPRIASENIASGSSLRDKKFKESRSDDVPAITRMVNRGFNSNRLIDLAQGPEGPAAAERQLDGLLAHQEQHYQKKFDKTELLARLKKEDIKAICIPATLGHGAYQNESYDLKVRLAGAITGLQHYEAGINVPVVIYHCDKIYGENDKVKDGDFTLLGRRPSEFRKIAIDAIRELDKLGQADDIGSDLRDGIKEVFGIDVYQPLAEQAREFRDGGHRTIGEVLKSLEAPSAPSANRPGSDSTR